MHENNTWIKLVQTLTGATDRGRLEWTAAPTQTLRTALTTTALTSTLNQARVFSASVGAALYELSVGASRYAMVELSVWEKQDSEYKQLTTLTSSPAGFGDPQLASALNDLATAVELRVEREEDVVQRLIDGLND